MRKIILLILLLLLPEPCFAWHSATMGAGVTAVESCTYPEKQSNASGDAYDVYLGYSASYIGNFYSFTSNVAVTYEARRFTVVLNEVGDVSSTSFTTMTGTICTDNAGAPTTTCATGSSVATSTTAAGDNTVTFDLSAGFNIVNATRYWMRVVANAVGDASNYYKERNNGTGTESVCRSSDGTTILDCADATALVRFAVFSCN